MAIDLQAAAKFRAVYVGGNDNHARQEALQKLLALTGTESEEIESVQADASAPQEWFANVSTVPFFSDRRVMVVRSIGRRDPSDVWKAPLDKAHPAVKEMASLPETSLLVLVFDDEAGSETRQANAVKHAAVWAKLVTLAGGKTLVFDVDLSKTANIVRDTAAERGKKITPGATRLLCEMVGSKPSLALSELEKLILYVGDAAEIRETDVRTVVLAEDEYNVYQLVDAIISGNANQAVAQLRTLYGQTPDVEGQVFPRLFPQLLNQFRYLWQARFSLDNGTNPSSPDPQVSQWLPTKKFSSEPEWKQRKVLQTARKVSLPEIGTLISCLVDADAEIKGQKAAVSTKDTVERATLKMCKICAGR